jgi:hypothetical protein
MARVERPPRDQQFDFHPGGTNIKGNKVMLPSRERQQVIMEEFVGRTTWVDADLNPVDLDDGVNLPVDEDTDEED